MHIKAQCYSRYELNMITVGAAVERKPPTELLLALLKCPTQNVEYLLHHRVLQTLSPHEWLCGEVHISELAFKCLIVQPYLYFKV